ncbi:MAG: hypothetical protein ACRC8S_10065 [Fimbriiglobus sp.]
MIQQRVRRRTLPVLGMTTVGLAIGAGSFGLYTGATARPVQGITQQTPSEPVQWITAEPTAPTAAPEPTAIITAAAEEPAKVETPKLPSLPASPEVKLPDLKPVVPEIKPVVPALPTEVKVPDLKPVVPEIKPVVPAPVEVKLPTVPAPTDLKMPMMPAIGVTPPALPEAPTPPSTPNIPKLTNQWPSLPAAPAPITPAPVTPALPRIPAPAEPLAVTELAPAPRPVTPPAPVYATPVPVTPQLTKITPSAKPVELPLPVRPEMPPQPDLRLPPVQPGITVNPSVPEPRTPGTLTSRTHESAPGEVPMLSSFPSLKSAALGVALAMAPTSAMGAPDKIPQADSKPEAAKPEAPKADAVADLKKMVEDLKTELANEKKLREEVTDVILGKKNSDGNTVPGMMSKVLDFDARLKKIEDAIAKLDLKRLEETLTKIDLKLSELNSSTSKVLKPEAKDTTKPETGDTPKTMPSPKSTIRIVNEYPVPISMIVNGVSHRLESNQSKTVEIPAGAYTYELLNAGSQATNATIKEGDSITLRVK